MFPGLEPPLVPFPAIAWRLIRFKKLGDFADIGLMNDHKTKNSSRLAKVGIKLLVFSCWMAGHKGYGAVEPKWLGGTKPLTMEGDLSSQMVAGIDKFLMQETARSVNERTNFWKRDFSSAEAYEKSVEGNREHLRKMIGAVDERVPVKTLELVSSPGVPSKIAETKTFAVEVVRWPVLEGVFGEGLWLRPKGNTVARVVAIPDADQTPEMLTGLAPGLAPERQFARRLAEHGCEVLVPVLVDRQDTFSGNAAARRFTNQPHREWIYRQAYEVGRHIIGYEAQKILAAVDFFRAQSQNADPRIGVAGYGEGGLIAFYAAALDPRISATLVSGYFDSRQRVWEEPIYRNVFGLLSEFGDAEIATLIAPRNLIIEYSPVQTIKGPPQPRAGRGGAAPGKIETPDYDRVEREFERARTLLKQDKRFDHMKLLTGIEGAATGPGSDRALTSLLNGLGVKIDYVKQPDAAPTDARTKFDPVERQARQVKELEEYTQKIVGSSETARGDFFWKKIKASSPEEWDKAYASYRDFFREEVIGRFHSPVLPTNPRVRPIGLPGSTEAPSTSTTPKPSVYEAVLDVFPDVFAWGYLLVPADLKPDERRPVVVCQHGLEGVPADVVNAQTNSQAFGYYKAFALRLAQEGFVTFAPHNPYRGEDKFRVLQRKANPLKKSLFSVITAQHETILNWLGTLPFVDAKRIGFYGLSYGGKTAMRVPAALEGYALSICSGDFNEWVRKNAAVDAFASYMFSGEYEMPEWDLGHTFNYAEMAAVIAPRPFMVERGHSDGVGTDEWVAYEFAKVKRLYDRLEIGERTAIEYFNGPHTIHGVGTFEFLHKWLEWSKTSSEKP